MLAPRSSDAPPPAPSAPSPPSLSPVPPSSELGRSAEGAAAPALSHYHRPPWIPTAAGVGAGVISTVACFPLDVLKIRFQLQGAAEVKLYRGIIPTMRQIVRQEGTTGLFRGLGPSLMTVPLFWGIWWCVYDNCKEALGVRPGESGRAWQHGVSAIAAAALSDVVTQPLWVVRTRVIALVFHSEERAFLGRASTLGLLRHIAKHEGVGALYRGLSASLLGLSHVAIQLPLYEALKEQARLQRQKRLGQPAQGRAASPAGQAQSLPDEGLRIGGGGVSTNSSQQPGAQPLPTQASAAASTQRSRRNGNESLVLPVLDVVLASTVSKLIASAITYPHEVARARLQDSRVPSNLMSTVRTIYRREGFVGFYRGLQVSLLRVLPSTVVTFVAYESLVSMLDRLHE